MCLTLKQYAIPSKNIRLLPPLQSQQTVLEVIGAVSKAILPINRITNSTFHHKLINTLKTVIGLLTRRLTMTLSYEHPHRQETLLHLGLGQCTVIYRQ